MTLIERLRALVEVADPQGTVTVAWLAEQLGAEGLPAAEAHHPTPAEIDLTVTEVAELFRRGTSTVRTWLAAKEFPNAYRLHGREWRIPREDVAAMQRRQRTADRPTRANSASDNGNVADLGAWRKVAR